MSDSRPLGTPRGGSRTISKVVWLLVAGLVVGSAAMHMLSVGTNRIPVGDAAVSTPMALPKADAPDWFEASAQESIAKREYEASKNNRGLQAPNRAHNLRTYFEPWGVRVEDRTAEGSPVLFRMKTVAFGREGRLGMLEDGEIKMDGVRVENRRGGGVIEWYVNGATGLEHGYVLDQRPVGDGALQIEVSFEGACVSVAEGQANIETATGRLLEYTKLVVEDATGREVAAQMESIDAQTIRLTITDDGTAYPIVIDPLLTSTVDAAIQTNQTGADFGYSVAGAGDVNGDGFGDIIVGARQYDLGQADEGAAFIFHGGPAGISSGSPSTANTTLGSIGADFGSSVDGAGDVNGDGYSDVIVGAPGTGGGALLYLGSPTGIDGGGPDWTLVGQGGRVGTSVAGAGDVNGDGYSDVIVGAEIGGLGGMALVFLGGAAGLDESADATLTSDQLSVNFGCSVDSAGDVNGDGYSDVIVGARYYDLGQSQEGAAFVFLGSAMGISSGDPTSANVTLESNQIGAYFGDSVAGAGDVNSDGFSDVIIGSREYNGSSTESGAAFIFHGRLSSAWSGNPSSASASITTDEFGAALMGDSVAGAGDVNGDGYSDVIVGASRYQAGESDEGAAFVYHGGPSGIGNGTPSNADANLQNNQTQSSMGFSVAGAGDINGDGFADVIVGAPREWTHVPGAIQSAFIYHGGAAGIRSGGPFSANTSLPAFQLNSELGWSVAGAGDVNGDGYSDVIVGADLYDAGQANEGAAFVFHGGPVGITAGELPGVSLQSDQENGQFGSSVAGAGDVNGDGYADVIVGAYFYNAGQFGEGAAFVFHGGPSGIAYGTPATANAVLQSDQVEALMGLSVAGVGDVNGDGFADVAVGARQFDAVHTDEGAAFVFHGGPLGVTSGGPLTANATLRADQPSAFLGWSVARAGDVNGDGYADVIVGAPYLAGEGKAYVFHGSASGLANGTPSTANATLRSDQGGAMLGISVAGAGDVNGDGYADVIIGATTYDSGQSNEGAAFVFLGGSGGVAGGGPSAANAVLQSNQISADFGSSVAGAGDVNGDGYADVIVGSITYDAGETDEGAVFVYHGSTFGISSGSPSSASATLQSNSASASFGRSVAGAGDVNGDGYADVIVGAPSYNQGLAFGGAMFIFQGNGGGNGRTVRLSQLRGNAGSLTVEPWGSSEAGDFQVRLSARHPEGRGRVKLQIEACPSGINWGGAGSVSVTSTSWTIVTATGDGVELTESVLGLATDRLYRWRARVLFAPIALITDPPNPSHGPWRRLGGQAVEADIRTSDCSIICPSSISIGNDSGMCGAAVTYSPPSTMGMCGSVTCVPASGSFFSIGTTTVNCSTATGPPCSFTVTVNDTQAPNVSCPAALTVGTDGDQCSAVVSFATPSASDNCPGTTVSCVPSSGSTFPIGTTMVTCTATDASANTGSCSFPVTVNDSQAPTVSCPSTVTVGNDPGQCSAVVSFATPSATDNCPGSTVACVPPSGSTFPLGTTIVTCTATDAASNTGACSFTVTVNDTQSPVANCPAPISVGNDAGQCSAVVNFSATASDNCPGASVACVPASGSAFPIGTTMVTCTATDASSNTSTCGFSVTVSDTQAPALSCPSNIQTVALTSAGRAVSFAVPTATDNCGATVACVPASGSTFAIGTTTVTCTATDAANNSTSCQFTVAVAPLGTDTAGIYVPTTGSWFLRNANSPGAADLVFGYGPANLGWIALRGDWDGNGTDTAGLYDPANGNFFLRNTNAAGGADLVYGFGPAGFGWQPLVGDWDGDGVDTIGLYDPSSGFFFLRNTHAPGAADLVYGFGPAGTGWTPMTGDWDGNGTDTVGLYDPATGNFFLRNAHAPGGADLVYGFGPAGIGWKPLAGDWNGDGMDTIGLYSPVNGFFFLRNFHAPGAADVVFGYGPANTTPILGDWNGL